MTRVLLALAMGIAGCLPALAADPFDVPVRLTSDHHLIIDTWVNDEGPYPFIVDSAASGTIIFDNLSDRMALERVVSEGTITLQASSGSIAAEVVELGSVRIGAEQIDLPYILSFSPGLALEETSYGILGADVLYRQPVGFALSEGRLHLYRTGEAIDPETDLEGSWFAVEMSEREGFAEGQGFYWIDVAINGVTIPALIDTGAQRSTINSAAAVAAGIDPAYVALTEDAPIQSASPDMVAAWIVPVSTLQLGERVWAARTISLADLPIFASFEADDQPVMILGADFLAEQNFVIDPIGRQLWVQARHPSVLGNFFAEQGTTSQSAAAD